MAKASVKDLKGARFLNVFFIFNAKAVFNQAALYICICMVDNFNKVLAEMTKQTFPTYAFCEQTHYLHRHLIKSRCMNLISRLQELITYLDKLPLDAPGQETTPVSTNEIMDIIYHFMPIM